MFFNNRFNSRHNWTQNVYANPQWVDSMFIPNWSASPQTQTDKEGNTIATFVVAGVPRDKVKIELTNSEKLSVTAKEGEKEYAYTLYCKGITPDRVSAVVREGLLTITIKPVEPKKPALIPVL